MTDELDKAIDGLNKRFGAGTVMRGNDGEPFVMVDAISTGSLKLDKATGVGGFPRGKITHMWGAFSAGKSTLCLQAIANAQKQGLVAAFIDMENAIDTDYAADLGVDMDAVAFSQPDTGEQALEIADTLMRSGLVHLIIIDSVAAMSTKAQVEGEYSDRDYAAIANLLSRSLSKLKGAAKKNNVALILTNQARRDFDAYVPPNASYEPLKPFGGKALLHYADLTIWLRRRFEKDKRLEEQLVIATCEKNKLAIPLKKAEFAIEYGKGVDQIAELVDLGVEAGVIEKSGKWHKLNGNNYDGAQAIIDVFREDEQLVDEIREKLK